MRFHRLSVALCLGLILARSLAAEPAPPADLWRAASRLGYGPLPAGHVTGQTALAWAQAELARAAQAARQPASLPAGQADFAAPLSALRAGLQDDRAQRQKLRADSPQDLKSLPARPDLAWARQAAEWRLLACSRPDLEPPLLARMTEFWFNHLNVSTTKPSARPFVGHYLLSAIRANAFGRYEDLLLASARHPAMLHYLDQVRSVAPETGGGRGLNENYARELLELHTLGVDGGYTQQDVRELARMLTGWTEDPQGDGGFRFVERLHDRGEKRFLGQTVREAGVAEGEEAIRRLARHPATAQRIARRLAQWFVADDPPPALVERLAQRYLDTQGNIDAVMQTLLASPAFWDADQRLFKTPVDFACSVLFTTGGAGDPVQLRQAMGFLRDAGQPLLAWPTPDGYATQSRVWLSPEALTRRADFALNAARLAGGAVNSEVARMPWLSPVASARIAQEPRSAQLGLALAAPDFMHK